MKGIVNINNTAFKLLDNYELSFNGFESLNNATIKIIINHDIEFQYFDEIIIGDNYFYLVDFNVNKINNNRFRYEFQVVNPSIQLQNIFLPNRSVEKGEFLESVFEQFIEMYAPNLIMSERLRLLLNGVRTNQHTWSMPTLFEVFNELLQEFNAVITMNTFEELDYILLDSVGDDISDLKINNIVKKSDYSNHATNFKSQLKNAISNNIVVENISLVTPNEPVFNDSRFMGLLSQPVERLISVEATFIGLNNEDPPRTDIHKKDLTPLFVEKTIYDTLKASNAVGSVPPTGYKRNHLWYETGGNILGGFDYNDKSWFPISNNRYSYDYWGINTIDFSIGVRQISLKVTYEAQINDVGLEMKKDALATQDKTIMVNQSDAYVDLDSFAKQQQINLNRAGEIGITIYGEGTPPKLRDYYQDFYIYSIKMLENKSSPSWMAEAKRGFSYSNLRTAISSEKRFTQIEAPNKAFLSNHITSYDFEFNEELKNFDSSLDGIKNMLLFNTTIENNFLYVKTDDTPFIMTPLMEKYGNSLVLFYRFVDNYSAGLIIESGGDQVDTPYVNDVGRFQNIKLKMFNDLSVLEAIVEGLKISSNNEYKLITDNSRLLPSVKSADLISYLNNKSDNVLINNLFFKRNKRNREITAETIQFNLLSNEKVLIFDEYLEDISWGEDATKLNKSDYKIGVNFYPNKKYTKFDNNFYSMELPLDSWEINNNGFRFITSEHYYGVVILRKVDNKPILAYNGSSKALYLNKSYRRLKKNYTGLGYGISVDMMLGLTLDYRIKVAANKRPLKVDLDLGLEIEANHSKFKYDAYILDMSMGVKLDMRYIKKAFTYKKRSAKPIILNDVTISFNYKKQ